MANFSVTIANGAPMLGMSPSSGNWGSLTWNAFLWGYTLDLPLSVGKSIDSPTAGTTLQAFNVGKGIASTTTPDPLLGFDVSHAITEASTTDTGISFGYLMVVSNTQALDGDLASETIQDPAGYYLVFVSNTTNAENRDFASWTEGSAGATTWAASSTTATTWS